MGRRSKQRRERISSTISPVLTIFCLVNALSIFLLQAYYTSGNPNVRKDQAFYAEVSTTSQQTSSSALSPGEKIDLPILVYHIVRPSYPDDSAAVRALALTPEAFDAEMLYLHTAGYRIISFEDLENYFQTGKPLPGKAVIISFDDGWSDQYKYAFPILKKYHYTATFFVFTNPIGRNGFLTWDQLKEMRDAGMTIGNHSRSHPYLNTITDRYTLWDEVYGSKLVLEKELGIAINQFAYPFGQYNDAVLKMIAEAGYHSARGDYYSGVQAADRIYELSAINAPTTIGLFAKKFPAFSNISESTKNDAATAWH